MHSNLIFSNAMIACNRFLLSVCLLLGSIVFTQSVFAQNGRVADYKVETFSGGFNSISNTGNVFYWYDPWRGTYGVSLPFDFKYDGQTINAGSLIYAGSNGAIALRNSAPPVGNTTVWQGNASQPSLLNFMGGYLSSGNYHDYSWYGDDEGIKHYYQTQGTSPNRVFIFEIRNIHAVGAASGNGNGPANFVTDVQVKLYETTNVIEFVYSKPGLNMGGNYYTRPSIGLNGVTSPSFSYKTVETGVGTVPSANYRFLPPPPPSQLSLNPKSLSYGNVDAGTPKVMCATVRSVGTLPLTINSAVISGTADFKIISGPANGTVLQVGSEAQYCISFDPLASGTRNGVFTVFSSGADSGTQQVALTGNGIAPDISMEALVLFRKSYVRVGDSLTIPVPFRSSGTGPLRILGLEVEGASQEYIATYVDRGPIPPGQWDSIYVTFKPESMGRHDALVHVNSNAITNPRVTIKVNGIAIMPRLEVLPKQLLFDSVKMGETVCKEITLFNPGTDTVNILRVIRTFSDADFTFTPLAAADTVIYPEQTKRYTVCFTPRSVGTRVANLRFYSDIGLTIPDMRDTSQFVIDIMGTGVPTGDLVLTGRSDSSVIGIQTCVTDTLRNIGSADITVTQASIVGPEAQEYILNGLTLPLTLLPGEERAITYCLTPAARGLRNASLAITGSTASQVVTMSIPLNGVGLEVCALSDPMAAFNAITLVGQSDQATITVTNCGDLATSYTASLPPGTVNYILGPATSGVVAPGGTAEFLVTFQPQTLGAASSTLTITGNGAGSQPMSISLAGIGGGVVPSATGGNAGTVTVNDCVDFPVSITNDGNVDWTPGDVLIEGANAADFTFVSLDPQTITPGSTATLTLRYCPTVIGASNASISFPNSAPATPLPWSYNLAGAGQQSGRVPDAALNGYILGQTYPNPLVNVAQFDITVPRESHVSIDIFDQTGKMVRNIFGQRVTGTQRVSIESNDLPAGTYNYVMTSGDIRLVRQMTIVR